MKYKSSGKIDFSKLSVDKCIENSDNNLEQLMKIDSEQKRKGLLLWRSFKLNVGDGYVHYQVTKLNSNGTATVELCEDINLDLMVHPLLGTKCDIDLKNVTNYLK